MKQEYITSKIQTLISKVVGEMVAFDNKIKRGKTYFVEDDFGYEKYLI